MWGRSNLNVERRLVQHGYEKDARSKDNGVKLTVKVDNEAERGKITILKSKPSVRCWSAADKGHTWRQRTRKNKYTTGER